MGLGGENGGSHRRAAFVAAILLQLLASGLVAPVSAPTTGTLLSNHSETGVDANGDRLFNYLRVDVALQVQTQGKFTIRVVLNDSLDLGRLTQSSASPILPTGTQTVGILLDGPDIYNGGVDGPYYAHITLLSDYGAVLSTGVHRTARYAFTDFQPFHARFVPPASERTLDNDSDGLVDWIDLSFTLDVATPATYTLSSLLVDSTFGVSESSVQTKRLEGGRHTLHQLFLAYPLRLAALGGPYRVTNSLYYAQAVLIDFLYVETAAYDYRTFEGPPAVLNPPHGEMVEDPDGDGLYNTLRFDVGLAVTSGGTYVLRGRLYKSGGQLIQAVESRLTLPTGILRTPLTFAGSAIYSSGSNGSYRLDLEVLDLSLRRLASGTHYTAFYSYRSFEPKILELTAPHDDQAVDFDADGKFDALRLLVYLRVEVASSARIEAGLRDGTYDIDLARGSSTTTLPLGTQVVPVDFAGVDLLTAGVDGPYRVWISVHAANGELLDEGGHRTKAHLLAEFEPGIRGRVVKMTGEAPEDVNANGLYNRLRVRLEVNVSEGRRYLLQGLLLKGAISLAAAESRVVLQAGSSVVGLVFGGPDIRASKSDGPYYLRASLWDARGEVAIHSSTLVTAAYIASSFEPAVPVTIRGYVVSDFMARPLAGATVRILDYVNYVSRSATTDTQGYYSLFAYAGTYWMIVDHPDGEAEAWSRGLAGDVLSNVSLALARRTLVEDDLRWMGWDRLLMAVRYIYAADAPALRFHLDWWEGNRDGWVDAEEAARLQQPADRTRDILDSGSSQGRLSLGGVGFVAVDSPYWSSGATGTAWNQTVPIVQVGRTFRSETAIGMPSRALISLETYYDTQLVDYHTRVFSPGAYTYFPSSSPDGVSIYARKIPFTIDPQLDPLGSTVLRATSVELLLTPSPSYVVPTPLPPITVTGWASGSQVTLCWNRATINLDGSRIANLVGYHIYRRASTSEPFVRVNPQLITTERFTDSPGIGRYSYAVSAVNTDGVEGPMSVELAILINF